MKNKTIIITPKCEADRAKCKAYVRVYRMSLFPENEIEIERDNITVKTSQSFHLIDEVEAQVIDWYGSDYRVHLHLSKYDENTLYLKPFLKDLSEKEFDFWYNRYSPFHQRQELAFVLRFEAPAEFKSVCI
jgi:hypothetical protein